MRNHSNEDGFELHENGRAGETHFYMNGFARRLFLTQRQKVTRKWPIDLLSLGELRTCLHSTELFLKVPSKQLCSLVFL